MSKHNEHRWSQAPIWGALRGTIILFAMGIVLMAQNSDRKIADLTRKQILALGDSAIEPLLRQIHSDLKSERARVLLSIEVLASIHSARAERALIGLLSDSRPFVRGDAALMLGRKKSKCAVPALTKLLGDPSAFYVQMSKDPNDIDEGSVGWAALLALRRITGVPKNADEYAFVSGLSLKPLYENWWHNKEPTHSCE